MKEETETEDKQQVEDLLKVPEVFWEVLREDHDGAVKEKTN